MLYLIDRTDGTYYLMPYASVNKLEAVFDTEPEYVAENLKNTPVMTCLRKQTVQVRYDIVRGGQYVPLFSTEIQDTMSKSLKKLIDINRLREFKNKIIGADSAYVQTTAVDQTIAGTKTFSKPIAGSVTGSSGSCTGNAASATKATQDSDGNQINTTYSKVGHTHDDRYYTENEVNNLLNGKANTSHTHSYVRSPDNNHSISLDWSLQSSGYVGLTVDTLKKGGVVTTANLSDLLGGIGVYDRGSTILALTGTRVDYGDIIAGSGLRYAALNRNGGIYDLDISIGATGAWVKVSGNSSETSGFGLYRRIS